MMTLIILWGGPILTLIYSAEFEPGIVTFKILSFTLFTTFINTPLSYLLLAKNRQNDYLKIVMAGAILNLVLNILLIPKYSLLGAAIATVVTELLLFILYLYFASNKNIVIDIGKTFFQMIGFLFIIGFIHYLINDFNQIGSFLIDVVLIASIGIYKIKRMGISFESIRLNV